MISRLKPQIIAGMTSNMIKNAKRKETEGRCCHLLFESVLWRTFIREVLSLEKAFDHISTISEFISLNLTLKYKKIFHLFCYFFQIKNRPCIGLVHLFCAIPSIKSQHSVCPWNRRKVFILGFLSYCWENSTMTGSSCFIYRFCAFHCCFL